MTSFLTQDECDEYQRNKEIESGDDERIHIRTETTSDDREKFASIIECFTKGSKITAKLRANENWVHIVALIRAVSAVEQRSPDNSGTELSLLFDGVSAYAKKYEYGVPTPAVLHLVASDLLRLGLLTVDTSHRYHSTADSADINLDIAGLEDDKRFKEFFTKLDAADGLE